MHAYVGGGLVLTLGLTMVLYSMFVWWRDVIREATFEGHHTSPVQLGLRYGMILFILSEVMFFVAFFWGFFHSSLAPTVEIGAVWPPKGIQVLNPWEIPFLNTVILLTSGAAVTWAHHAILAGKREGAIYGLALTVILAVIFTGFQAYEYYEAPFTISDGIYGSTFFMFATAQVKVRRQGPRCTIHVASQPPPRAQRAQRDSPLVVKSKAAAVAPVASHQLMVRCRWLSWL